MTVTQSITQHWGTAADIPAIQALAEVAWNVAYVSILTPEQRAFDLNREYSEAALTQQMTSQGHQFLLLYAEQTLLGFASFSAVPDKPGVMTLHKIYLDPAQKGKGHGATLLAGIVEAVKAQKGQVLQLWVNRKNPAVQFYQRQGFEIIESVDTCIGKDYWRNDYRMEKVLV